VLKRVLRKPVTWVLLALLAVLVGSGLYWFEPWRLVTNTTVNDAISAPTGAPSAAPAGAPTDAPTGAGPTTPAPNAGPVILLRGTFITHEHDTTGEARVVRHPDGRRQLELVNLDTSDGPDLRVWLSDQPVREGTAGWRVFDDGEWVEVGELKGNRGNQVYQIPADADLTTLRSVTIWCKRFSVSFGAAALS
jgi:hypothetical protein